VALVGPLQAQQPSVEILVRQIEALQRRVDELEARDRAAKLAGATKHRAAAAPAAKGHEQPPGAPPPKAAAAALSPVVTAPAVLPQTSALPIPGLLPPEPMGSEFEDALRSDLPGLSIRIPGTASEARIYGFAKISAYTDFNGRNQTDAPAPQGIPLAGSPAAIQGGDFGMTARFSRIGLDTRTLTTWGTLETRIEGDFGGGTAVSNNALFRLRQAWAELGTAQFRVLIGQANSLWNEGMFETLIDATNLNQSFVRQAQVRATATLAPGLTGQISLETPDTQYTSVAGIFTPISSPIGGLSPAFTSLPDLLGRLAYRYNGLELDLRGLLREISVRTDGTAAAPPAITRNTVGWGVAAHARMPMRWLSEAFGPDQVIGMAYYGQGIGRYFGGNTSGQDALSNIGLPGVGTDASLDALPTYGATVAYRRFWTPQLRSNFAYSAAWQEYPSYALMFVPASASATSLNATMQQGIANLIWSPFAELRGNTVDTGWLDLGIEYVYTQRDLFGGAAAAIPLAAGNGTANRILASAIGRF
jgi:DcaP outer membrane protein